MTSPRSCGASAQLEQLGGRHDAAADPGRDAGVGERGALRADRRRAVDAAAAHRDRGRHPGDGVREPTTTSTRRSTAPRPLIFEVAETARRRHARAAASRARADAGPARGALRPRRRRSSACPPATTTSTSCCSGCSRRRSRSSRPGPARGRPRSRSAPRCTCALRRRASRCCSSRWRWATSSSPSGCSRPRRRSTRASSQTGRLSEHEWPQAQPGGRPARRGAVLHRRQPALHGHGDARQGAPHRRRSYGDLGLIVVDYLQLMASTAAVREPPGRGVGAVARAEDPRPRARRAGDDARRSSTASSSTARTSGRCSPTSGSRAASPPTRRSRWPTARRATMGELLRRRRARRRGADARRAPASSCPA